MSMLNLEYIEAQIKNLNVEIKSPFDERVQHVLLSMLIELRELEARHSYGPVVEDALPRANETMEEWYERAKRSLDVIEKART